MRYFTRGWCSGEFNEAESDDVVTKYRNHLENIRPSLSKSIQNLAFNLNLHDAWIKQIVWQKNESILKIGLISPFNPTNLMCYELIYQEAILGRYANTLKCIARRRDSVLLYDEVDVDNGDSEITFIHRFLFYPQGEISIWFKKLQIHNQKCDGRVELGNFFIHK